VAGVDEVTIVPDLDGLGRWLTAVLREEWVGGSHELPCRHSYGKL